MKNPFKAKKEKFPTPPIPRSAEEIKKEFFELRARAGEYQYQVSVLTDELNRTNSRMREINYEMDARQKLDASAAAEAKEKPKTQEVQ